MTDSSSTRTDQPTVAEIAALTARLRELSTAGPAADPDARAAFLADKHALRDRITAGQDRYPEPDARDIPLSRARAAAQLVALGHEPHIARQLVTGYLDDTSRRIGAPVHQWGLDQGDVDAIHNQHASQHRARDDGHLSTTHPAAYEAWIFPGEQERRVQLNRWHADDTEPPATLDVGDGWADR